MFNSIVLLRALCVNVYVEVQVLHWIVCYIGIIDHPHWQLCVPGVVPTPRRVFQRVTTGEMVNQLWSLGNIAEFGCQKCQYLWPTNKCQYLTA